MPSIYFFERYSFCEAGAADILRDLVRKTVEADGQILFRRAIASDSEFGCRFMTESTRMNTQSLQNLKLYRLPAISWCRGSVDF